MTERKGGRPKSTRPKDELVRFRVTPEMKMELKQMAEDKNISMSSLLTLLITEYLDKEDQSLTDVDRKVVNGS